MRPSVRKLLLETVYAYPEAMLAIDFVGSRSGGTPYYMLNGTRYTSVTAIPGWTYTGGTPAGVGSYAARRDGSLQFFPSYTNLLLRSQEFDNASWVKADTTISADVTSAPDGTLTADKLAETATTNSHTIAKGAVTVTSGTAYTVSFYMKAAERTYAAIYDGITAKGKFFNLSAGTVGGNLVGAPDNATITSIGGGWYRCAVTITTASTSFNPYVFLSTDGTTFSYAGTSGSGIYLYGAQLELGSTASTYIPTTSAAVTVGTPRITDAGYLAEEARTNLLLRSQEFDNASWLKGDATIAADQTTAPDGTLTADKLNETATTAFHYVLQTVTWTATSYTQTVFAKAAERSWVILGENSTAAARRTWFNLSNGTVGTTAAGHTATITAAGNGWYRCSITFTASAGSQWLTVNPASGDNVGSYAGTAGSGIYIWQADLQAGSFATSPIPTTSVAVTRSADVGYVSGLVVPSAGTLVASLTSSRATGGGTVEYLAALSDGTTNNRVLMFRPVADNSMQERITSGGVAYTPGALAGYWTTGNLTGAISYAVGNGQAAMAGATGTTSSPASIGTMNRLSVGNSEATGGSFLNAPIQRIVIYPRAMGAAELQAITTAGAY